MYNRARKQFPRDHGAHPEFRIEWWYVTGWLDGPLGFQITFFAPGRRKRAITRARSTRGRSCSRTRRSAIRSAAAWSMTSAPRAGFSLAHAELDRTGVWIDDWRLELHGNRYDAHIAARDFAFDFHLFANQLVLQGEQGFSRKGHRPHEASYYYSRPH